MHTCTRGDREAIDVPAEAATGQDNFQYFKNRGKPLAKFWSPGTGGGGHMPRPPPHPYLPGVPPPQPPLTQGSPSRGWVPPGEGKQKVSTLKTINIILKTPPPASAIRPATLLPPASTFGPADVEQSPPCPAPPAPTQHPAPYASTLHIYTYSNLVSNYISFHFAGLRSN